MQSSKYKWVVLITVLVTYFIIVTQRTAPGLITDQLMREFSVTASTMGLLASIQFLAYAGLQIPIGILSDRFGPNYFLIGGALLNGIGTIIYSLSPNEYVLFLARLLVGIGDSAIWVNLVLILSIWSKAKEFVGLIGVAGMSGNLGSLVATVPFSAWIAMSQWRGPFLTTGIILCFFGGLLYFVLEVKPKQTAKNDYALKSPEKTKKEKESIVRLLTRVFSDRQSWATFLCHFGLVGTYIGFIGSWAVPYGMHVYGLTRNGASWLVLIGLIGAIIGAPLTSWIANRLDSIKGPYVVAHAIVFLSWSGFLFFHGKPPYFMAIILFLIIGFGIGASSLTFATVRVSFPIKEVGVASGFANTGGFISAILLPSIFGKILDHFHTASSSVGYFYGFIIPALFSMLGLIGGLLIQKDRLKEE